MKMTADQIEAAREQSRRAIARARALVKPGDWLRFGRCGGGKSRAQMTGWSGPWMCSKTLDDIAPSAVTHLNGQPIDFSDAGGLPLSEEQLAASNAATATWLEARHIELWASVEVERMSREKPF